MQKLEIMGQVERNFMENTKIGNNGTGGKKFDGKLAKIGKFLDTAAGLHLYSV